MNETLTQDLYLKYPKILKSESGIGIYLEVGDGWYDIIDILCSQIQHHIDWKNGEGQYTKYKDSRKEGETVPQLVAEQVKEKFGGLRFYAFGGDEKTAGMIELAEALSHRVCEVCGSPGKKTSGGWIRTLCRRHAEEQGREFMTDEEEDP
jgi:hypothetical protein